MLVVSMACPAARLCVCNKPYSFLSLLEGPRIFSRYLKLRTLPGIASEVLLRLDHEQDVIRSQVCLDHHRVCLNLTLCSETIPVKNLSLARQQTTKSNKLNPNKWISHYTRKPRCLF